MTNKLITVYGATGRQGESVALSLLANQTEKFRVRCITRDVDSAKAKMLVSKGAELIQVNPGTDGFENQLQAAFHGSWGVFLNVDTYCPIFETNSDLTESELGKGIVDLAFDVGVEHLVYSTLPDVAKHSKGLISIPHFQEKAKIAEHVLSRGFQTATLVSPGWYLENYLDERLSPVIGGFPFQPADDGYYTLQVPTFGGSGDVHYISVKQDYGDIVHGIFLNPSAFDKQTIQALSAPTTQDDVIRAFETATGKNAKYKPIAIQNFETYNVPGLLALQKEFLFCHFTDGNFYGTTTDRSLAQQLKKAAMFAKGSVGNDELTTADAFFARHFGQAKE